MSKGHCLVIGAGVSGLSSGIRLLEDGWKVTIWSAEFSPNTTSDVAAALWYPFLSAPVERTNAWGFNTYHVLKDLAELPDTGVTMTQTHEYFRGPQSDPIWKDWVDSFERRTEGLPADYVECFSFITSVIEMPIYLKWMLSRYTSLGGITGQRTIDSFEDFPNEYTAVINCTGLSSGDLLNDNEMYPIRGQIIRIKAGIKGMYLDQQIESLTYIVPRSQDVILGGVAQQGNWDLNTDLSDHETILKKCGAIIPEIKEAVIIEDLVGLRPGRSEVRLEKEHIQDRPLVHNYGHGGSGVTLSWGCADEVVELVNGG